MHDDVSSLTQLGSKKTEYQSSGPSWEMLEVFPNKYPERTYSVSHECFEFTSRCPKTDQPDFGEIYIEIVPKDYLVETKSLKLYLGAYRNEGSFMETLTNKIAEDVFQACRPIYLKVKSVFNSRGGIQTTTQAERWLSEYESHD